METINTGEITFHERLKQLKKDDKICVNLPQSNSVCGTVNILGVDFLELSVERHPAGGLSIIRLEEVVSVDIPKKQ